MASGNPFSPSMIAIKMSFTPRFLISVITRSQNFAPFGLLDPDAEYVLAALGLTPIARYTALLRTVPSSRILTRSASKNTSAYSVSRDNQDGKRDNQDGKFFEGVVFEPFGSDLTL